MSECKIGPSSASYIYTELWDHNETNQQVASYLQGARDKSANKPQIVAAYAGDFYQGGDAVTFTIDAGQGGTVTLVTRYARQDDDPAYHQMILDMGQPTQKLIKYVHFDATGSYDTWKEMTETVELTPGVHTISFWVRAIKRTRPSTSTASPRASSTRIPSSSLTQHSQPTARTTWSSATTGACSTTSSSSTLGTPYPWTSRRG
ncbi:carbohydrate binding module [Actinomyces graevenitzii F0530]|uniref:Carbohydrate binding module n=1 Tax=Actinomyces graevenitzii F0530 TaxID=1321817 RepID=U1RQ85_9ACTO|nr:carbohydrate-binding protein [Actinomyces graevenitzii]ERH20602.1 carbohydrate binding module [Actinomyces graevenitzii F0530]